MLAALNTTGFKKKKTRIVLAAPKTQAVLAALCTEIFLDDNCYKRGVLVRIHARMDDAYGCQTVLYVTFGARMDDAWMPNRCVCNVW